VYFGEGVTPFNVVEDYRCLEAKYCCHLQGSTICPASKEWNANSKHRHGRSELEHAVKGAKDETADRGGGKEKRKKVKSKEGRNNEI
jgi:hypothetical protein